jgi:hypothetical protein
MTQFPPISEEERATILAALRAFQDLIGYGCQGKYKEISTNGGVFVPLDIQEIDHLCERINMEYEDTILQR